MKNRSENVAFPRPETEPGKGLSPPGRERSNCGVGVLMELSGESHHGLIEDALNILENLDHRGARGAEEKTGDGAGMLLQKPHDFFDGVVDGLPDAEEYGVGQAFFPQLPGQREAVMEVLDEVAGRENFEMIATRDVPTNNEDLGKTALDAEPAVVQFFVQPEENCPPSRLDSRLYVLRRVMENTVRSRDIEGGDRFYICSLDRRKIVYKGQLTNAQLRSYYPDLSDRRVASSLAFVHSRFSTNTLGAWELAHPYRNIIHNGEINTLRGNINWMKTREADLDNPTFGDDVDKLKPVTREDQSDTAILDNVLELIVESGRNPAHALRMLVPEAWNKDDGIDPARRRWYDYHSTIVEPWDGPLLVAYTDGKSVGAILDRNGLRPCRYLVTNDDRLVMASETGVLDIPPEQVRKKGRLEPGQMFMADAEEGRIIPDEEVFDGLTDEKYGEWLDRHRVRLGELETPGGEHESPRHDPDQLTRHQTAYGYTLEELRRLLKPMGEEGKDPIGSMGDDTPLSVLSNQNRTLFSYFKQLFAQVSNPPIDYIREDLVTSLEGHLGRQKNMLGETPEHCRQLHLESPILRNAELATIRGMDENEIEAQTLDITYPKGQSLQSAVEDLRHQAVRAIVEGFEILILSDRKTGPNRVPIPSLLAVGGVHHHLIREGLRTRVGLVLESGQPCAVHHFCTLIGYGAGAVNPYLAYESIRDMIRRGSLDAEPEEALEAYVGALETGVQKVMSKMGISTLESYKGAQIFEAVGLDSEFVHEFFYGTTARTGGIGTEEIEQDLLERHQRGFGEEPEGNRRPPQGGDLYWRRDGEFHQWNPQTIGKLQHASRSGDYDVYREFAELINDQDEQLQTLRGLMEFDTDGAEPVPLEEVEPVEEICSRFFTASMSFGSLSKEVHETLAVAMNRIGGKACTGGSLWNRTGMHQQTGCQRALRGHQYLPGQRRGTRDQDGPGFQTRGGWPPARGESKRNHRGSAPFDPGRLADLTGSPPRHLLDRGSGSAHPRPQVLQPGGRRARKAGLRGRGRNHCRGRGQGPGRRRADQRSLRGDRGLPQDLHQIGRTALGTGTGRGEPGAPGKQPSLPHSRTHRRWTQDRPRRGRRRPAGGRGVRVRDRPPGDHRLRHAP